MNFNGFEITPQSGDAGANEISISVAAVNEGIDKVVEIDAISGDKSARLTLIHEGMRQPFGLSGGGVFRVKGGGRFGVLKEVKPIESSTPIEYIQFAKDKIFDTGIFVEQDMTLEVKFAKGGTVSVAQYMYGVITSPHKASVTAYLTASGAWRWGATSRNTTINDAKIREVSIANGKLIINGKSHTFSKSSAFKTPYTLPIGGVRSASGTLSPTFTGVIYYFRLKKGDNYILDLTPVRRNSDGVECFWDNVSQTFIEPMS